MALAPKEIDSKKYASKKDLLDSSRNYATRVGKSFAFLPYLAELLSIIKPLNIYANV